MSGGRADAREAPRLGRARWWLFAVVAYGPLLLTDPGKVASDTKSYLYLDPSRMLASAPSMWDPHVGLGTVTHQNVGYLFPMGPFFWVLEELLRAPAWVAQRLWLGTLLFAAGMGIRYLLKTLGVVGPGVPVAMLAYAFTPYVLEYSDRLSVLLGPWAALPWLIAFTALAVQRRGWRYPALIALTVQLVGGVNATALLYALIGPLVYAVFAVAVTRETDGRRLWSALWRTALLTTVTSLWWLSGLFVESRYGLNVLQFTEKITDVSATAYPFEIVRGLGYWLLYGRDPVGWWDRALLDFTRDPVVLFVSLLIPTLAMCASAIVRWHYRLYCVVLVVAGVAIAVGAAPYTHPSIVGGVFKSFATSSTLGLALRSTSRATPLVALGFAGLLAAGINAFVVRMQSTSRPGIGIGVAFVIGALCLVNAVGSWRGTYYTPNLERGAVPAYWRKALTAADAQPHDTRLLSLPGSGEAAYTWGDTIDPIEPGLIDRPFDARELVPMGSAAGANLLEALDGRLQAGTLDTAAVAPVARLMAVGDVLLRNDLQSDAFNLVPAATTWRLFNDPQPAGLAAPQRYGTKPKGRKVVPPLPDFTDPPAPNDAVPPVAIFPVEDPEPIVRVQGADAPVVVAGDGEGLVDLASAGLLDAQRPILYSASYATKPAALRALPADAVLVLTDSNRRRAQRGGLSNVNGYTETAGEKPLVVDSSDQRPEVFPGETDASRTVDEIAGIRSIEATSYGSIFGYTTARRPEAAFDGDPKTTWVPSNQKHQKLVLDLTHPITTNHIDIEQPAGVGASYIKTITLRFDGGHAVNARLDRSSQQLSGERVSFPTRRFSKLEIDVDRVHNGVGLAAFNPIGFSEIRVGDDAPGAQPVRAVESMRLPTDLLAALGASSAQHPLVVAMSAETTMDQLAMRRTFNLPTARTFSISGSAVLSDDISDTAVDRALGLAGAAHGGITATSTTQLTSPDARAANALDGDPATAWNTPVNRVQGARMRVALPAVRTIDHLDLQLRADGRHSVPTQLRISGGGSSRVVTLPTAPLVASNGIDAARVSFAPLHTRTLTVTITKDQPFVTRTDTGYDALPAGIAELGIPGVRVPTPAQLPGTCTAGLFTLDGHRISVRITGSTADALHGRPLTISACGADATLALGSGSHQLVAVRHGRGVASTTPFDLQRLVLASAGGGRAAPAASIMNASDPTASATVTVAHQTRTALTLSVPASDQRRWLVFGESLNAGWHAKIDGHDLGAPQLIDGYANGWLLPSNTDGRAVTVALEWTPQRLVWVALWVSLAGGIACLVILGWSLLLARRRAGARAVVGSSVALADPTITVRPPLLEPALVANTAQSVVAVVVLGGLAAVVVRPWVGVLVGVLTYLAIRDRRARMIVRYAPAAIVLGIALGMAGAQTIQHYATGTHWPSIFSWARIPMWIALFLLLVDATVEWMWCRRAPSG